MFLRRDVDGYVAEVASHCFVGWWSLADGQVELQGAVANPVVSGIDWRLEWMGVTWQPDAREE